VGHVGEIEEFTELARTARPQWLLLACIAQAATYLCAAAVWHGTLRRAGHPVPLGSLVGLSVAKLFTDKAAPSGGISGNILVLRYLSRRHIPAKPSLATLWVSMASYYTAYVVVVAGGLLLMWMHHRATRPVVVSAFLLFAAFMLTVAGVIWLRRWSARGADRLGPAWIRRCPALLALLRAATSPPTELLGDRIWFSRMVVLQITIFALDTATLWLAFLALGAPAPFWVVFVGFVTASVTATIAPIPLGLGAFEGGSVAMLSFLGLPVEAALTATLIFRGLSFWAPMLPGLWLSRREFAV
jgi:uncharacterized protein (TIRG00374 family)